MTTDPDWDPALREWQAIREQTTVAKAQQHDPAQSRDDQFALEATLRELAAQRARVEQRIKAVFDRWVENNRAESARISSAPADEDGGHA
jgi:hypothetical protein